MSEKNIPNSPKVTLTSNSSPLTVINFCRGVKLSQFRQALELTRKEDRDAYKTIVQIIKLANIMPL